MGSRTSKDRVTIMSSGVWYVFAQASSLGHLFTTLQGLTPALFWRHKHELLSTSREDLSRVVEGIVQQSKVGQHGAAWRTHPTPVTVTSGWLFIGSVPDMPSDVASTLPGADGPVSFVIVSANAPLPQSDRDNGTELEETQKDPHILRLKLAEGKKDQLAFLQTVLPAATRFIKARLTRGEAICVCCDTGKDASVGIVLTALQLFFDDRGALLEPGAAGVWSRFQCTARTFVHRG